MFVSKGFPRRGTFAKTPDGRICICVTPGREEVKLVDEEIGGTIEQVKKTVLHKDEPFWEVHLVDSDPKSDTFGQHVGTLMNVPSTALTQCAWNEIAELVTRRNNGDTSYAMLQAHRQGYALDATQLEQVPHLEAQERAAERDRLALAQHPEVLKLEAELQHELEVLSAKHDARRKAIASRVLSTTSKE